MSPACLSLLLWEAFHFFGTLEGHQAFSKNRKKCSVKNKKKAWKREKVISLWADKFSLGKLCYEKLKPIELFTQRWFAFIELSLIWVTNNPGNEVACLNFSKLSHFFTQYICETKSVTPICCICDTNISLSNHSKSLKRHYIMTTFSHESPPNKCKLGP